jgi:outer membrane protein OmpA-like peptidoglycan-associated protein
MHSKERLSLVILVFCLLFIGCTSAATKQAIQSDYENARRAFNQLPANSKECAPQEYARAEVRMAHIEEELSEKHWKYAGKYMPEADTAIRQTGAAVKRNCPPTAKMPPPPPAVEKPSFVLRGITFDFDKATIRSSSEPTLNEAGGVMQRFGALKVRIEGHTDSIGAEAYNQRLSGKRANAVKDYLVNNFEVAPSRIETVGYGEAKPVADNKTKDGRAQNRRIEFVVTAQ